jgi:hypothetical protein
MHAAIIAHVMCTINTASLQGTSATITGCTLQSNTAVASGGALFVAGRSGSVSQTSATVTLLSNSLLLHNNAVSGGAVSCDVDANVALTSCSIGNNTAVSEVSVTHLHIITDTTEHKSVVLCRYTVQDVIFEVL